VTLVPFVPFVPFVPGAPDSPLTPWGPGCPAWFHETSISLSPQGGADADLDRLYPSLRSRATIKACPWFVHALAHSARSP
jgi:hypothetical protein